MEVVRQGRRRRPVKEAVGMKEYIAVRNGVVCGGRGGGGKGEEQAEEE